jgi:hypothetical protein
LPRSFGSDFQSRVHQKTGECDPRGLFDEAIASGGRIGEPVKQRVCPYSTCDEIAPFAAERFAVRDEKLQTGEFGELRGKYISSTMPWLNVNQTPELL